MPNSINDLKQPIQNIKRKAGQERARTGNYMRNDPDRNDPDLVLTVTVREITFTLRADEY